MKIFNLCKPYLLAHKLALLTFISISVLVSTSSLISPYIIGDFIDQLMSAQDMHFIYRYFAIFASINLASLALGYISGRLYIRLQTRMGYALNRAFIQRLQHAPLSFTDKQDTAYLNQRINNDANSLIIFCIGVIQGVLINFVIVATALGLMFVFHPMLAGILLCVCVIYFVFYALCKQMLYRVNLEYQESRSTFFSKLNEQLFNIRFVKLHGLFSHFINRLNTSFGGLLTSALKHQRASYIFSGLDRLVYIVAQMILLLIGGREIIAGRLTIGRFIIISSYYSMMLGAIRYFFNMGQTIQNNMVSYNRLRELEAAVPEPNGEARLDAIHSVELKDISFSYGDKPVLEGINLRFTKGRIYVLLGPNGAGKSTLADVLIGLQAGNYTGQVLFNGEENIDMYDLRNRLIGISEQEPTLLADSVASNLSLDKPDILQAQSRLLDRLVNILGLEAYIHSLPDRLETQINESAANISGGEKQKLSILRALIKAPDVVVLDEPTSALDVNSKAALRAYLDEIKDEKIIIVVTHDKDFVDVDNDMIVRVPPIHNM